MPMPFAPNPTPTLTLGIGYDEGFDPPATPMQLAWDNTVDQWMVGVVPGEHDDTVMALVDWLEANLLPSYMLPTHYREVGLADDGFYWWDPMDPTPAGRMIGIVQRVRVEPLPQPTPVPLLDVDGEGSGEPDPGVVGDEESGFPDGGGEA